MSFCKGMSNRVVAILSVLKPVDDTRNYEKIAVSLSNTNKYDINIIGFWTKKIPLAKGITFHPIFHFQRNSLARILAPVKIWQILYKLKPELIIVTCTELLAVTCLYKIIFGTRIVFDVQENYYRNILYSGAYSNLLKYPLAYYTRVTEYITSPFIDLFILAEKVYEYQLTFMNKNLLVVENKATVSYNLRHSKHIHRHKKRFLYCGTITRHYGIFDAISFFKSISTQFADCELIIAGYAPDKEVLKEVLKEKEDWLSIKIVGGSYLLTHSEIVTEMMLADYVLLPYQPGKSLDGRIPTKLYECLAMEIPIIIAPNPSWNDLVIENMSGIIHDFKSEPMSPFIDRLQKDYYGNNLSKNHLWGNAEPQLLQRIDTLFKS